MPKWHLHNSLQISDRKMGDASSEALAYIQESDTVNVDSAREILNEDYASNVKMGDQMQLSGSANMCQRNEEGEHHSTKDNVQTNAEVAQSDVSDLHGKTSLYWNKCKNTEENLDGDSSRDCSPLSANVQECEQQNMDPVDAVEPAKVLCSNKIEELSSTCEIPEKEEYPPLDHDLSISPPHNSKAVSHEHMVEVENGNGYSDYISKINSNDNEKAQVYSFGEKGDGFGEESDCFHGTNAGVISPGIVSHVTQGSFSVGMCNPPLSNGGVQQQKQPSNELIGESEFLSPSTIAEMVEVHGSVINELDSFLDPSNQEWSDLDFGEATIVSTGIEGWHQFDTEAVDTSMDYTQGSHRRGGTWEHLLDDGLDAIQKDDIQPLQIVLPSPCKEDHFELTSPGNPFLEGLDRASSFSEADGSVHSRDLPCAERILQVSDEPVSSCLKEGSFDGKAHSSPSPDTATIADGEKNDVKPEKQEIKLHRHSSSLDFMEPFEAPSFMSLVDPKSHALFGAFMPTYHGNHSQHGHENDGEKWVANFDLVVPSMQEITRSMSLPRTGSDIPGQLQGHSVSFTAMNRELEPSKKEPSQSPSTHRSISGFLSPKLSPLVQKVVDKVRSTPVAANGMLNSVRQAVTPKASDKKSALGSLVTRCMCW